MSRNSLAAAKQELYALVSGSNLPAGVTAAYNYEPLSIAKPVALTISTAGMDADYYQLALRIYHTIDVDVAEAQANLDTLILAVENKLTSGFNVASWSADFVPDSNAWVATCVLSAGREDNPYG